MSTSTAAERLRCASRAYVSSAARTGAPSDSATTARGVAGALGGVDRSAVLDMAPPLARFHALTGGLSGLGRSQATRHSLESAPRRAFVQGALSGVGLR